jgi:dTDP-6-deoxy-L-talose 4-dehydrogenase (NAD+)
MRILVTGASGFIGKRVCGALLASGHEVAALCRSKFEIAPAQSKTFKYIPYVMGEILPKEVEAFEPEALIHLAWDGIPDFSELKCVENYESQIRFFIQTKSLSSLKKIICSGTCREYASKQGVCFEGDRMEPDSYFSWAKQALSDFLRISCIERNISFVWFRIFFVYGPGQRKESLIPTLIRSYKLKILPNIKNPNVSNDYIYIDDVVNAIISALKKQNLSGIYNLGSGKLTTVSEIALIVENLMIEGTDYLVKPVYAKDDDLIPNGIFADTSLASNQLEWSPKTDLADGIRRTIKSLNHE